MNSRQLECFIMAAQTGSFAQVAERLFLSVSTVSYQIRNLEEELGVTLFIRYGRHVECTASGQYYFDQVQKLSRLHRAVLQKTRQIDQSRSLLTVGFTREMMLNNYMLLDTEFRRRQPEVELRIIPVKYRDGVVPLMFQFADLMFTYECRVRNQGSLDYVRLTKEDFYCVVSAASSLAKKKEIVPSDLAEQILIYTEDNAGWMRELQEMIEQTGPVRSEILGAEELVAVRVRGNQGVSIQHYCPQVNNENGLVYLPFRCGRRISRVLAWRRSDGNPAVAWFRDVAVSALGERLPGRRECTA